MTIPLFKVTINHGGTETTYSPDPFTQLQVTRRENNYDIATLWFADRNSQYYEDMLDHFDEVKIYLKQEWESGWTQIFGGWIRQVLPTVNQSGFLPQLLCKGYGMALEETHCNRDYGIESANPSYPQPWNIWTNIIADFVEQSFGGPSSAGWGIDNTNVSSFCGTDVKYINNPYRTCLEVVDLVCELTSAIGAGSTAGAHWIVDHNKTGGKPRFLVAQIGDHTAGGFDPTKWPDWWITDAEHSTFVEGLDFTNYSLQDKSEEFANNVILITDFRRPVYDYWTSDWTFWGNAGMDSIGNDLGIKIVGPNSLKFTETAVGYAYYPSAQNAAWDVTKWGSVKTIPRLNFYFRKKNNDMAISSVRLCKTDYHTDFYECIFNTWSEPDDTWIHKSIPIGPYWESAEESQQSRWVPNGAITNWTIINCVAFCVATSSGTAEMWIDDLHFSGKIGRSAMNSWSILGHGAAPVVTAKNEYQKVLISRNAMDDSCVAGVGAGKDDGFAARIAYAELLRRQKRPKTITFITTRDMKAAMPGQKIHVHVGKRLDGTFRSSDWDTEGDMRILELREDISTSGCLFTVTATTDLLNSAPISVPDQYAMWQENMFLNSKEAKNIRSGSEVDLLIPLLESDYQSDDD